MTLEEKEAGCCRDHETNKRVHMNYSYVISFSLLISKILYNQQWIVHIYF
jgi:hypothetical protein